MKSVVRYETVPAQAAELAVVFPRHKAYLDAFEPADEVHVAIHLSERPSRCSVR